MGKILEALEKNEKSTASELAKLCGVEPKDVIAVLVRLERDKRARQCNGYWYTGRREFLVSGKGKALVRMGLVEMKPDPVVFWFERYKQEAL